MRQQVVVSGAVVLVMVLAGCAGDPSGGTPAADEGVGTLGDGAAGARDGTSGTGLDGGKASGAPVLVEVPVVFEGNLGTWFYACEYRTTGVCQGQELQGDLTDFDHDAPGAVWVAADLSLSWDAPSPATATLGFGVMRMGTNSALVRNAEGASPQVVQEDGLDLALDADNRIHLYVYNAVGLVHEDPVVGYATADQAFRVDGTMTLLVPASS